MSARNVKHQQNSARLSIPHAVLVVVTIDIQLFCWMNQASSFVSFLCFLSRRFFHFMSFSLGFRAASMCVKLSGFVCVMNGKRERDDVFFLYLFSFLFSLTPFSGWDGVGELFMMSFCMISWNLMGNLLQNELKFCAKFETVFDFNFLKLLS